MEVFLHVHFVVVPNAYYQTLVVSNFSTTTVTRKVTPGPCPYPQEAKLLRNKAFCVA